MGIVSPEALRGCRRVDELRFENRLPVIQRFDSADFFRALSQDVCDAPEDLAAVARLHLLPLRAGLHLRSRGFDRCVHIVRTGRRHVRDLLLSRRIDRGESLAALRVDKIAVDEQAILHYAVTSSAYGTMSKLRTYSSCTRSISESVSGG